LDEEFFFPQNVRTSYRLWLLGPRHLKRLTLAPVILLLVGWALHGVSIFLAAVMAGLLTALYTGLVCVPLLGDDQTLSDVGLEILRHRRRQSTFRHRKEVTLPGAME
jgi:hypothetical protein